MTKPSDPEQAAQNEQLLQHCERLQAQVESLTQDYAALQEQLAAAEFESERLVAIVDAEAEDLQQFGSHWFRPSAVVSITRDNSAGILINGNPIGWGTPGQQDTMSLRMQEIALEVNRQNAEKRARARPRK